MVHFNSYCYVHLIVTPTPLVSVELQISEGFEGGERLVRSSYPLGLKFLVSINNVKQIKT
jgi:hypothetical protein